VWPESVMFFGHVFRQSGFGEDSRDDDGHPFRASFMAMGHPPLRLPPSASPSTPLRASGKAGQACEGACPHVAFLVTRGW